MVALLIHRTVLVALAVVACRQLAGAYGTGGAMAIWAATMAVGCALGTVLLHTSAVGRVTWRNRLAGWLMPWGARLNRGKLWPIPVVSWVVWMALGLAAMSVAEQPAAGAAAAAGDGMWRNLLLVAWIVDGAAALYLLGVLVPRFSPGSRSGRSLLKILAVIAALVIGSVALFRGGAVRSAALMAGGPPAVLALGYGLFLGAMLWFGRNARWN